MPTVRKSISESKPLTAAQRRRFVDIKDKDINFSDTPSITAKDLAKGTVKPAGRGGSRAGAGRKPSGRVPVSLRLKPTTISKLRARAKKEGRSLSDVAEEKLVSL